MPTCLSQVLVFLDSHIEVNREWLEPLLARIHDDPHTVVVPYVDNICSETFVYMPSPLVRGGFNWALLHNWDSLPERFHLHNELQSVDPIQ
jgi:polypeptide N-acetylgalactosaminyltransferase